MLLGFVKVYLQIILRKIKEGKNYVIYYLNLKNKV